MDYYGQEKYLSHGEMELNFEDLVTFPSHASKKKKREILITP
jgi:hypothetical protein